MPVPAALPILETAVRPDQVDYNGHMNDAAYATVFSSAIDALMDWLGIDADFRAAQHYTLYTLELHLRYLCEALEGTPLAVDVRLLDDDAKRLHVFETMRARDAGTELATCEVMLMGIDRATGRPAPFPPAITERIAALRARHGVAEWPQGAGRRIGIRQP